MERLTSSMARSSAHLPAPAGPSLVPVAAVLVPTSLNLGNNPITVAHLFLFLRSTQIFHPSCLRNLRNIAIVAFPNGLRIDERHLRFRSSQELGCGRGRDLQYVQVTRVAAARARRLHVTWCLKLIPLSHHDSGERMETTWLQYLTNLQRHTMR